MGLNKVSLGSVDERLVPFDRAGLFEPAEVHFAVALHRLEPGQHWTTILAAAMAMRAPRLGFSSFALAAASTTVDREELPDGADANVSLVWPEPLEWAGELGRSSLVAASGAGRDDPRPLVLSEGSLYLDCFWRDEQFVLNELARRGGMPALDWRPQIGAGLEEAVATMALGGEQQLAVARMLSSSFTVVTGGPGTGKTRMLAAAIRALRSSPALPIRIRLAAPTGKAAARLAEAIHEFGPVPGLEPPTTLHRLLGMGPRFRAPQEVDADVVIVDECSMVGLSLMAELLASLADDTRLVLVGDPHQLPSVDAGMVLADVVQMAEDPQHPLAGSAVRLTNNYRFDEAPAIAALAAAVLSGDGDAAVAAIDGASVRLVSNAADVRDLVTNAAVATLRCAQDGDEPGALASLTELRVLCAHRRGPFGVVQWNKRVEEWLRGAVPGLMTDGWYAGRPVLVTKNDPMNRLNNGDLGVALGGASEGLVALDGQPKPLHSVRLSNVETVHAMTIHKAQGSEFDHVVVVLPPADSPLATRELIYTAVTRARRQVILVGEAAALKAATETSVRQGRVASEGHGIWRNE